MKKYSGNPKKSINIQDQFYRILRTTVPARALENGVYVDKIDNGSPNIYDCCSRVLGTVISEDAFDEIMSHVPTTREMHPTDVLFYTPRRYNEFNLMGSNVQLPDQTTVLIDCIYTNDTDFNVKCLTPITNESECDAVLNGQYSFYYEDCIYIMKILSREFEGDVPYYIQDILVYLPESVLNI